MISMVLGGSRIRRTSTIASPAGPGSAQRPSPSLAETTTTTVEPTENFSQFQIGPDTMSHNAHPVDSREYWVELSRQHQRHAAQSSASASWCRDWHLRPRRRYPVNPAAALMNSIVHQLNARQYASESRLLREAADRFLVLER